MTAAPHTVHLDFHSLGDPVCGAPDNPLYLAAPHDMRAVTCRKCRLWHVRRENVRQIPANQEPERERKRLAKESPGG